MTRYNKYIDKYIILYRALRISFRVSGISGNLKNIDCFRVVDTRITFLLYKINIFHIMNVTIRNVRTHNVFSFIEKYKISF